MAIETHRGLKLEITTRAMSGALVPGRPPRQILRYLLTLPAAMVLVILLVPMAVTTVTAFDTGTGFGFDNFIAIGTDPGSLRSLLHTALWVVVAVGVAIVGFGLALLSRKVERWWLAFMIVLVLPFGASSLASGAAFRLLFDPAPERGTVSAVVTGVFGRSPVWLGPTLIWIVLILSFGWTWVGFAVSLFRAGLRAVPSDVVRRARVEGAGWLRQLKTTIWMVGPVGSIIVLTLVVAAARVFDLVLIAAPGPMQDEVDTVAVHWWRLTAQTPDDPGRPAALAVASFVLLGLLALALSRTIAHPRTIPKSPPRWWRSSRRGDAVARGWSIVIGTVVSLLSAFPVVVLVATALHSPTDAGAAGWWHAGEGLSLESIGQSSAAGLVGALMATLAVALGATGLLMIVALFAAPALALSARPAVARALVGLLTVLSVAPVQMYAIPLRNSFAFLGLAGSRLPLIVVHAAAGLPLAVVVLRSALAAAPGSPAVDALLGQTGPLTGLQRIWAKAGPAVVAVAVMEFVLVWNDFIISFLISGPGSSPLTLVLWGEARQFATSSGTVAASAVISSLVPVAVLLATWRRWVVPGWTGGVLK